MSKLIWVLYVICLILIISSALNYGITRFVMGVPFMAGACFMAWKYATNRALFYFTIVVSIAAIALNISIEKNPYVFPVLNGGHIETLEDGYYVTYSDGSEGFVTSENCPNSVCQYVTSSVFIKKDTIYNVEGIRLESSGLFERHIYILMLIPDTLLTRLILILNT